MRRTAATGFFAVQRATFLAKEYFMLCNVGRKINPLTAVCAALLLLLGYGQRLKATQPVFGQEVRNGASRVSSKL
ncbi:hypothetical protein [uncultured Roseobacter sp.]|uniref:hypothetical protein n=1 Tax=uncultured Roseobacter sp. TaxID=114847 RepID=UPI002636EA56|nr:hypothetical protein [uncultured Roseobacter sp.]